MKFIGRQYELKILTDEWDGDRSSLVVLYGRRRVGKTRLLEEFCRGKSFFRFEGLEKGSIQEQMAHFARELSRQTGNPLIKKTVHSDWHDALDTFTNFLPSGKKHIVIFDEFPWMICEDEKQVALFKYYWDNHWARMKNLMIVFCGSVNSFMVKKIILSSALYGRIHREIKLDSLSPQESRQFLGQKRSLKEVVDLYMVFGGVPKYLEEIDPKSSAIQNINRLCFLKNGYFVQELQRLFKDEYKKTNIYLKIAEALSAQHNLNYAEIMKIIGVVSGGGYHDYLQNLILAGFAESYTPLNKTQTQLVRYRIVDEYVLFYFNMILPNLPRIGQNTGKDLFVNFIGKPKWSVWSGLSFEGFCLKQAKKIQEILKIDQLVKNYGSYFNRKTTLQNGLQIDLMFERHDSVVTLCEIKYTNRPIGLEIIESVEKKANILKVGKNVTIERVLITGSMPTKSLIEQGYFHKILSLEDFF